MLRDRLGARTVKDGCSPQGQCGCCTVWIDGAPRVSCVTPARRVEGRQVTTLDGLPDDRQARWADALVATGGSQCGFCTPGIIMRLAALETDVDPVGDRSTAGVSAGSGSGSGSGSAKVDQSLLAHLCRCTGWQTIEEAAGSVLGGVPSPPSTDRRLAVAAERAALEAGSVQQVGPDIALGRGGFGDDGPPPDALVAIPDAEGSYVVAGSLAEARVLAGKVQGRRTTVPAGHPVEMPPGEWALILRTAWIEPAYVEPDASWCAPGGTPSAPCANGGAFGGKRHSPVEEVARRLADQHDRPVRVLWSREDVVRWGPKRPPVAIGMAPDGTGVLRLGVSGPSWTEETWAGVRARVASVAPGLVVEPVEVVGPPTSTDLRGAVWVEAAVVEACRRAGRTAGTAGTAGTVMVDVPVEVVAPGGGRAVAQCGPEGALTVTVEAGDQLDAVVLRSYAIGAAHQAVSWVTSEGLAVDDDGVVGDLTIRSFGILPARATPPIDVRIEDRPGAVPVNGSDAVLAAVAAAKWLADGLAPAWPTGVGRALLG